MVSFHSTLLHRYIASYICAYGTISSWPGRMHKRECHPTLNLVARIFQPFSSTFTLRLSYLVKLKSRPQASQPRLAVFPACVVSRHRRDVGEKRCDGLHVLKPCFHQTRRLAARRMNDRLSSRSPDGSIPWVQVGAWCSMFSVVGYSPQGIANRTLRSRGRNTMSLYYYTCANWGRLYDYCALGYPVVVVVEDSSSMNRGCSTV